MQTADDTVSTVAERDSNVLVTFAILAYNQEAFIDAAINGALEQDWINLEIILSDDCSSDSTFARMQHAFETYAGSHRIKLNRNQEQLGIAGHVNTVVQLSTGALIVIAAGDDISYPSRTMEIMQKWKETGYSAGSFYSGYDKMTLDGQITRHPAPMPAEQPSTRYLINHNIVVGATEALTRELFDTFGPLDKRVVHEDRCIATRASMLGGVHYIDKPLVAWRQGGISSRRPGARIEARQRNALRYVADIAQSLLDFQSALAAGFISKQQHADLVSLIASRLNFEAYLLTPKSTAQIMRLGMRHVLGAIARCCYAIYKSLFNKYAH